ncbi:hypothetical protein V6N13_105449 [Hibiscus sabdariffa]|uniref:Uncharacterized protein n=1 Tax=Hibiscus sabdariffa TaxID=183260 RepID=A0ABR2EX24_9ROSI
MISLSWQLWFKLPLRQYFHLFSAVLSFTKSFSGEKHNHFEFQKAEILQHLCQVPRSKLKGKRVALGHHMLYD